MDIITAAITDQEKYDASVKTIFSQPRIIAEIMRAAIPEYQGMTVEEILPFIVEIRDTVAVDDASAAALQKLPEEQTALLDKTIRYDFHIKAKKPEAGELNIFLFFDIEFQNEYRDATLGYPLEKRAMYYVARELSSQLGVLAEDTNYGSLQKSYSIWICNEHIPKDEQNSMTRYHITKEDVIGKAKDMPENYDLMEVIFIRRGNDESDHEIFDFLNGIFSSDAERITKYSGRDEIIENEVKKMGGFGQALAERKWEEGRIEGRIEGRTEGRDEMIITLLKKGKSPEEISDLTDIPLEHVRSVEKFILQMV